MNYIKIMSVDYKRILAFLNSCPEFSVTEYAQHLVCIYKGGSLKAMPLPDKHLGKLIIKQSLVEFDNENTDSEYINHALFINFLSAGG